MGKGQVHRSLSVVLKNQENWTGQITCAKWLVLCSHFLLCKILHRCGIFEKKIVASSIIFLETQSQNLIQQTMRLPNLLSLPHLLVRWPRGNEPLVDYSQSRVVTSVEYLSILRNKPMDKVAIEEIKEGKWKEIEDKRTKRVSKLGTIANRATIKILGNHVKAQFTITWTPTTIKQVGDRIS